MTPEYFKNARRSLGLSAEAMAVWLGVRSGRTVRRWEAGDRAIPGPVAVLVQAAMDSAAVRKHFRLRLQSAADHLSKSRKSDPCRLPPGEKKT